MTKKDYQMISACFYSMQQEAWDTLGDTEERASKAHWTLYTAIKLADKLALTNPRFDRDRFLSACGIDVV